MRTLRAKRAFRLSILAALCLGVGMAFVSLEIPGENRLRHALQNAGHGLAFATLAFAASLLGGIRDDLRPARLLLTISVVLFAFGIGIEALQHVTGRGASGRDLGMNLIGIVAGASLAIGVSRNTDRGPAKRTSIRIRTRRTLALLIGMSALLWCLRLPIAIAVVDALAPPLPLLATFEQPFALAKLAAGDSPATLALVETDARWPTNPTTMLEARFPPGRWPGFRLVEPPTDWRAYRTLAMVVANPTARNVRLHVRVDQRAVGEDIFWSSSVELDPGINAVRIDLRSMRPDVELSGSPDHEPFLEVSQILIFLAGIREPVTLLLDDVELRR